MDIFENFSFQDKKIRVYGTIEQPLFLLKNVAEVFNIVSITPTEKKNETEKCKTILSGDVNAPSVRACFHLTAFYSG